MIPEQEPALLARTGPEVEGPMLDGTGTFRLSEQRGRRVVIAFWASWCTPCRRELPALADFARAHPEIRVVAVNVDREEAPARAFLAGLGVDLPVVLDTRSVALGRYRVLSMPTMFLVDEHGTVKYSHAGFSAEQGLVELERALAELP